MSHRLHLAPPYAPLCRQQAGPEQYSPDSRSDNRDDGQRQPVHAEAQEHRLEQGYFLPGSDEERGHQKIHEHHPELCPREDTWMCRKPNARGDACNEPDAQVHEGCVKDSAVSGPKLDLPLHHPLSRRSKQDRSEQAADEQQHCGSDDGARDDVTVLRPHESALAEIYWRKRSAME